MTAGPLILDLPAEPDDPGEPRRKSRYYASSGAPYLFQEGIAADSRQLCTECDGSSVFNVTEMRARTAQIGAVLQQAEQRERRGKGFEVFAATATPLM